MRICRHVLIIGLTATLFAGCGIFGDKDEKELPPAKLLKFEQTLKLNKAWSTKIGGGTESLRLALVPVGDGSRIYAASFDGRVGAFDPANGKRFWLVELDEELSAGPGVGGGLVVVAGIDGTIFALNSSDGATLWSTNVVGESLARPLVTKEGVVIYTIDGRLRLLSLIDGSERWSVLQDLPSLTLRGTTSPVLAGANIVVGFDNGRLVSVKADTGDTEWEAMISPPSGRSDLERLADVDGQLQLVGQDIYVAGYHGRVASLAAESGQVLWAREISTYVGVGADWNNIYAVSDEGELIALLRRNGTDVWRSDALLRREPTAPVAFDLAVVVADFEGYVHFFSSIDGTAVARVRVGSDPISQAPIVIGENLFVQSESGHLAVFTVPKAKPKKSDKKSADDDQS